MGTRDLAGRGTVLPRLGAKFGIDIERLHLVLAIDSFGACSWAGDLDHLQVGDSMLVATDLLSE